MSIQAFTFESKYITFRVIEKKPKTDVYLIETKTLHRVDSAINPQPLQLGIIKFYPNWRQYSFFPETGTVFEKQCMQDIISFMKLLNDDLRKSSKERRLADNREGELKKWHH